MTKIFIGTSGYAYADWKGQFYPQNLPSKLFLQYYIKYFNCAEINYTYYRFPSISQIEGLVKKSNGQIKFSIKMNHLLTHQNAEPEMIKKFMNALEPILENNLLVGVLFQFPYSFKFQPQTMIRLRELKKEMQDTPMIVEFRHDSWINSEVFKYLKTSRIGFCVTDCPRIKELPNTKVEVTSDIGYVRFHGRNRRKWWDHEHAWERYNYLYSKSEIQEWIPRLRSMSAKAKNLYVYFNNHYSGQAVQNAQLLMAFLSD